MNFLLLLGVYMWVVHLKILIYLTIFHAATLKKPCL